MKKSFFKWLKRLNSQKNQSGFTLLEMLIVLLVIGLLMAIIIPNVSGQRDRIQAQAKENIAEVITTQANTYQMLNGESASVTPNALLSAGFLTDRQVKEAENLLGIQPDSVISLPIVVNDGP